MKEGGSEARPVTAYIILVIAASVAVAPPAYAVLSGGAACRFDVSGSDGVRPKLDAVPTEGASARMDASGASALCVRGAGPLQVRAKAGAECRGTAAVDHPASRCAGDDPPPEARVDRRARDPARRCSRCGGRYRIEAAGEGSGESFERPSTRFRIRTGVRGVGLEKPRWFDESEELPATREIPSSPAGGACRGPGAAHRIVRARPRGSELLPGRRAGGRRESCVRLDGRPVRHESRTAG